jgi:hypothetical protein
MNGAATSARHAVIGHRRFVLSSGQGKNAVANRNQEWRVFGARAHDFAHSCDVTVGSNPSW